MKKKNSAFTASKRKKQVKTTIDKQPLHRFFPKGHNLSWRSSHNLILRTTGHGEVSERSIKAFRKALLNKRLRKLFVFRAAPILALTKKPNEVRMGKGRGIKISKRIFPFIPGQILVEVNLRKRVRLARSAFYSMQTASRKFPFRTRVSNMDI